MTPLIETRHLTKNYVLGTHTVHALREASVQVGAGEFVAIMGPSGSGKSTFMNLLGCLDSPTSGQYLLEGRDISGLSPDELASVRNVKLGFVFQSFNLLPRTSAWENVALPLIYAGAGRKERLQQAWEKLEAVNLADRADHHPSQLSGGQQQRVAIARALVNNPVLLLADEPTGNLDSRTSVEIMALFQELNAQGLTIVVVTHEPDIAQFAKRVVTFRDGRILRDEAVPEPRRASGILAGMPLEEVEA
jgi:putative ABC transport system ATP-binding protein